MISTTKIAVFVALLSTSASFASAQDESRYPIPITVGHLGIPHGYLMVACKFEHWSYSTSLVCQPLTVFQPGRDTDQNNHGRCVQFNINTRGASVGPNEPTIEPPLWPSVRDRRDQESPTALRRDGNNPRNSYRNIYGWTKDA